MEFIVDRFGFELLLIFKSSNFNLISITNRTKIIVYCEFIIFPDRYDPDLIMSSLFNLRIDPPDSKKDFQTVESGDYFMRVKKYFF